MPGLMPAPRRQLPSPFVLPSISRSSGSHASCPRFLKSTCSGKHISGYVVSTGIIRLTRISGTCVFIVKCCYLRY